MSIILIVAWQWLPFATLILLTALQSLDEEQKEAAQMDGAGAWSRFCLHDTAAPVACDHRRDPDPDDLSALRSSPKSSSPPTAGPARRARTLTFLVYAQALLQFDVGGASAGGIIAVILANIVAFFLMRMIGKTLEA